jgi:hypothetical protein
MEIRVAIEHIAVLAARINYETDIIARLEIGKKRLVVTIYKTNYKTNCTERYTANFESENCLRRLNDIEKRLLLTLRENK